MPDKWEQLRSLPFPVVIGALGFEPQTYKTRKQGSEWFGKCPVHQPKANHTSFSYHANGKWNCFSCNAKGRGALDLVIKVKDCGFEAAVAFLESLASQPLPDTKKQAVEPAIASGNGSAMNSLTLTGSQIAQTELKPLEKDTWRKFQVPCEWLEKRVPDAGVRERYGVFCYNNPARKSAYSNRVMLPVKDTNGLLYGYLGRNVDTQEPKYLFPKNLPKSRFLFGAHELAAQFHLPVKVLYLLESPFAVMKFASLGLPAVSPFGWSVSTEQISLLQQLCKGLVYLPDKNKAGIECQRVLYAVSQNLWLRFPPLPDGIDDPENLTLSQIQALTR